MKRSLDLVVGVAASVLTLPLIGALVVLASFDTGEFGLFSQRRVGRNGEQITVRKIRTMRTSPTGGTVTRADDPRITSFGSFLRRWKLDELPQFWSVTTGTMSLVGPRPDVAGYADLLEGDDRKVLSVRPGITGPATLLFRAEADLLLRFSDPAATNDRVIWPLKVAVNRLYVDNARLSDDLRLLLMTITPQPGGLRSMLERWDPAVTTHELVGELLEDAA